MTERKVIVITAVVMLLLCSVHFFSTVYVKATPQQRELNASPLTSGNTALPYNADTLAQIVAQWSLPVTTEQPLEQSQTSALAGFDNARLGDTNIALLAIYQQQQSVAVLALQTADQPVRFVRLNAGDSAGDIELSQVNRRDVTITRGAQQVQLRLFNPGSASSE